MWFHNGPTNIFTLRNKWLRHLIRFSIKLILHLLTNKLSELATEHAIVEKLSILPI